MPYEDSIAGDIKQFLSLSFSVVCEKEMRRSRKNEKLGLAVRGTSCPTIIGNENESELGTIETQYEGSTFHGDVGKWIHCLKDRQ